MSPRRYESRADRDEWEAEWVALHPFDDEDEAPRPLPPHVDDELPRVFSALEEGTPTSW